MSNYESALKYLKAIEKKYNDYFERSKISIIDCVIIAGKNIVSVHVVKPNLPFDIRHDIEMMFWAD